MKTRFKTYPVADMTIPMKIPRRTSRILLLRSLFDLDFSDSLKKRKEGIVISRRDSEITVVLSLIRFVEILYLLYRFPL